MEKLIKINAADNVFVVRIRILPGERLMVNGTEILFNETLGLGHKIASCNIDKGQLIIKFGVPIGSATENIPAGTHIHLHNIKSNYIPTFKLDEFINP